MNTSAQIQSTNEVLVRILNAVQGVQEVLDKKQAKSKEGDDVECMSSLSVLISSESL